MSEPVSDLVELTSKLAPITREEAEANPSLAADQAAASDGVNDDQDAVAFDAQEAQAAQDAVLAGDEHAAAGSAISPHQQRMLAFALTQKGVREHPPGSNINMYSQYFGFGAQFWCADFLAYCIDVTGAHTKTAPWGYPSAVRNITAWGQSKSEIHSAPMMGDIFTRKDAMHTGFVLSAQGSNFMTIEGNTSGPAGDIYVASHSRDASSGKYWFVRDRF
jgi:hypothetical protein